ncbi:short-chain dehydrogenase [Lentithecium fluviatile CBS 122367]|uniref:Short-chain dehydrogenase n=1 Tax=Lentithecium fluviatile CBS 122367 TaxID=1168545 RepID=A0A6G1IJJ4_9PLEO|nr:short-chain dehydrogenase [Lentithecium fluviatile CBS 122367]
MSNPSFGAHTTAEEVATLYSAQISSKTILITGVSPNGLGLHTALALAPHSPHLLILAARSPRTLEAAKSAIHAVAPTCPVRLFMLDLSRLAAVREAANEVLRWKDLDKIDVLINNAGVMSTPWETTVDGVEMQFAVNHLGPWLFTNLVMPKIVAAQGRVVFLSSLGHVYGGVRFEDVNFDDGETYDADVAYGQSKTANILTAVALAERMRAKGVTAFSVHPGLVLTNLTRHVPMEVFREKGFVDDAGNLLVPSKTHSQGCATTVVAALDPYIAGRSGAYLCDCKVDHGDVWAEHAKGIENAEKLWALSEGLVGEKFEC